MISESSYSYLDRGCELQVAHTVVLPGANRHVRKTIKENLKDVTQNFWKSLEEQRWMPSMKEEVYKQRFTVFSVTVHHDKQK